VFGIPRRYSHFIFGVGQAGLTSFIAAGIASFPSPNPAQFFFHWLSSWLVAWIAMLLVRGVGRSEDKSDLGRAHKRRVSKNVAA